MNGLNKHSIDKVVSSITGNDTSIFFVENNCLKVVEIMYVDKEVDLYLYNALSYFKKYGNLEEALDVGNINYKQYCEIKKGLEC